MFLNPLMLIGVGAAVVPFVLHLLSRARYRDVDWGAMMFLQGADVRRNQSARFTQILLLCMRSLAIALLALALARPVMRGKWAGQESEGKMTAVLMLDCSASMGFDENGRTRFQMAQAAARQIIRGLRQGDRVALLLMGAPPSAGEREPTGDLRAIEARIDEAKLTNGRANLAESLDVAAEVLGRFPQSPHDIYVVSDRQALSWQSVDSQFVVDWKRRMRGSSPGTRMFVLPVGSADADNIAVESVRLLNPPAIAGQQTDIEVVVRNYGSVQHAAIPVSIDGVNPALPERYVSLAGGQSLAVPFSITFKEAGSQVLSAKVKSSGYTGDDQFDMVVNIIPPIRVLVISGDERSGQTHGASDYLRWALAPHAANGVAGGDPCVVTVAPADQWSEADLRKYQVVVLANVERFTVEQATAIESYVYGGGRLLIAPGSLSRVENYNTRFYHEGGGILPARLLPPTAADGSEATSLLGLQTDHPVFQFMRGRMELPAATINRYFPTIPRQNDSNVLARYLTNDPFLIEASVSVRVLLMTTALDSDWTTLPLSNFYLPFVQSAIRHLASGVAPDGNLPPGKVIQLRFDDSKTNRTVWVMRPDGKSSKLEVVFRPEKPPEVRYPHTELPGTYRVQVQEGGKTQNVYFIVRPPREESDLTQLPEEQWQSLGRSLGFTRVDPTVRPVMEALAAEREGRELWGAALAAMLVLTVLEMGVARIGSVQQQKEDRLAVTEVTAREEVEILA
jgi:hypothetical protein